MSLVGAVIIWINGPFGVGKTTATKAIVRQQPFTKVVDLEKLGGLLRFLLRPFWRGDYQKFRAWQVGSILWILLVYTILRFIRRPDDRLIVVPMSVLHPALMSNFLNWLRRFGCLITHVTLDIDKEVLQQRISADCIEKLATPWRTAHVETFFAAKTELTQLGPVLDSTSRSPKDLATAILQAAA